MHTTFNQNCKSHHIPHALMTDDERKWSAVILCFRRNQLTAVCGRSAEWWRLAGDFACYFIIIIIIRWYSIYFSSGIVLNVFMFGWPDVICGIHRIEFRNIRFVRSSDATYHFWLLRIFCSLTWIPYYKNCCWLVFCNVISVACTPGWCTNEFCDSMSFEYL